MVQGILKKTLLPFTAQVNNQQHQAKKKPGVKNPVAHTWHPLKKCPVKIQSKQNVYHHPQQCKANGIGNLN